MSTYLVLVPNNTKDDDRNTPAICLYFQKIKTIHPLKYVHSRNKLITNMIMNSNISASWIRNKNATNQTNNGLAIPLHDVNNYNASMDQKKAHGG